jgi:hypothetical protein
MPSDAEMAAYARSLPPIYRDILAAFPEIEPGRKAGIPDIGDAFRQYPPRAHGLGEVQGACKQLAESGFIVPRGGPTRLVRRDGSGVVAPSTSRAHRVR